MATSRTLLPTWCVPDSAVEQIELYIADMTAEERAIVKAGCLINYNKFKAAAE